MGILFPISSYNVVFAQDEIPTVMDGLVNRVIDLHPSFLNHIAGARNTDIDISVLESTTKHEGKIYEQAQQWKTEIKPKMEDSKKEILNYNSEFQSTYDEIQNQITSKNKDEILKLLEVMQSRITNKKQSVTEFLATLKDYMKDVTTSSQQLQNDRMGVQATMDGYRASLDSLYDQLYNTTSDTVREQLENQTAEISIKLYDNLEPLYKDENVMIDSINGVNDGVLNVGWIISLEDMNTNWTILDTKLKKLIQNMKDASDINWTFITDDMSTVKEAWDNIYKRTEEL